MFAAESNREKRSRCKILIAFVSHLILLAGHVHLIKTQVISPELRRLAVSTNQFGIDTLRALDRIEPPEKVIVFSPICISSSLTMIMMGSSKYNVVSSLRQALYLMSMKPAEINRAFRDIFEHIGFNQATTLDKGNVKSDSGSGERRDRHRRDLERRNNPNLHGNSVIESDKSGSRASLPELVKLKELLDRSDTLVNQHWWSSAGRQGNQTDLQNNRLPHSASRRERYSQSTPLVNLKSLALLNESSLKPDNGRQLGDMSQLSTMSNIYIQRGLAMNHNYNLLLRQFYKTVIHPVDFLRNWDETRQHINSLIASGTEGKIKELIKRNSSGFGKPKIMMISTFHFRGTLDIQIKNNVTRKSRADNRTSGSSKKSRSANFIDTEETLMKFGMFPDYGCSVVEIPFNNRLISLIVVMPLHNNMTEMLLTKLSARVLSDMVSSLTVRKLSIEIPIIKFDRGPVNVDGLLRELSLNDSFYGDKFYSTESGLSRWLRPVDIIHETSIDIGTINPRWSQVEDRLKVGAHEGSLEKVASSARRSRSAAERHLKLDKPFFYFVLDTINGLVLTMGRIRQ